MIHNIIWGTVLIGAGLWIWLYKLGVLLRGPEIGRDWPVIIVIAGMSTLLEGVARVSRRRRKDE